MLKNTIANMLKGALSR